MANKYDPILGALREADTGTPGADGQGVPIGGTTGQVLAKIDATNYNTQWTTVAGTGDVVGPASAVDSNFVGFDTTTGKLVKDSGSKAADFATAAHNHTGTYAPVLGADDNYVTDAEKTNLHAPGSDNQDLSGLVPKTYTVNTKALSGNISLNQDDVGDGTTYKQYSATEKTKLAGIEASANNYSHPATHSADIITDGTTNKAYTATEQTKLTGIATGAEVNVNADWNAVSGDALISNKPTLGTAAAKNIPATGNASATEVVYGSDTRLSDARTPSSHNNSAHSETYITSSSAVAPNAGIVAATKTKITYDAKGLVTVGADATTADIADSLNKRYVTDAQSTVIGNTSGTNSGDNAVNSNYSGLVTNATHSGEVTGSGALTITDGAVTLAKMANMATASLIYRKTASAGAPEVNTLATLKTDLGLTGTNSGDQTLPVKASGAEVTTGTDDAKFVTAKALVDSSLYSGWTASGETWTYASADDPTFTFTISGVDLTTKYSAGMRIKLTQTTVKYFIITAVAFSTNTTITVYGGTDYDLANATITSPYYSTHKAPQGFPLDPTKWSVVLADASESTQASPTVGTWYNLGSLSLVIPIGAWEVSFQTTFQLNGGATQYGRATLSTANNSESDADLTLSIAGSSTLVRLTTGKTKVLIIASKTTYYLNAVNDFGVTANLYFVGSAGKTIIKATSAYL